MECDGRSMVLGEMMMMHLKERYISKRLKKKRAWATKIDMMIGGKTNWIKKGRCHR